MPRTLIIGDVHGCAEELARLLDAEPADRVVLLGDVFAKGPDPAGCWRIVREVGAEAVLGNHDARMLEIWDSVLAGALRGHHGRTIRRLSREEGVRDWLSGLPLVIREHDWVAVHAGIHPSLGPEGTTREQALALRRWPDDSTPSHLFWWEVMALDAPWPLVVYGHDALRRVVDRRPRTLGLDDGCVYGGSLVGYIPEEDRVVRVPSQRAWVPA